MPITPSQIRNIELPRSLRGYDETATKKLLSDAAMALEQALLDRDTADQLLREAEGRRPVGRNRARETRRKRLARHCSTPNGSVNGSWTKRARRRLASRARRKPRRATAEKAESQARDVLGRAELEARSKIGELASHVETLRRNEKELAAALDGRRQMVDALRPAGRPAALGARPGCRGTGHPRTRRPRSAELDRTLQAKIESGAHPLDAA